MTNEKIARINELYKKSKAEGLSEEEKKEQARSYLWCTCCQWSCDY